jgi:hypothetical protein
MKTSEETKRMAFKKAFISMIDDLNETAFKSLWDGEIHFHNHDDMPVIKGLHHLSPKGKDKLTILINKFLD